jgi:hypothetical protein
MPLQIPFGKPYPRVLDPKPSGVANPRGLYRWSTFFAGLVSIDKGGLLDSDSSSLTNNAVQMLLFTNDIPVVAQTFVYDVNTDLCNTIAMSNRVTLDSAFIGNAPSGLVGPVTITNYGEVLKGYTTSGIAVSGFPVQPGTTIKAPLSGTVVDGAVVAGVAGKVAVLCVANGAVASGVVGAAFTSKGVFSTAAPTPIILAVGDYTQAIKDNDNLLVDADGYVAQVVGLYYVAA